MKTLKTLLVAAAIVGAPAAAFSQCMGMKERQTTMSCAPGTALDTATGQCVADATS